MPVGTGISAQQGMLSISETKRNHMGQGLGNTGGEAKQLLSGDAFALFHWHFYCDSFTREEDCIQNLLCTQRTFGNYWAFAVFSGPDLIANLSDGLKIMDPGFITCDDIGKLLFVIFWKHLKQLFGHFNPLPLLLVSQQMWYPSSRNLSDFQMLFQNKVNRW